MFLTTVASHPKSCLWPVTLWSSQAVWLNHSPPDITEVHTYITHPTTTSLNPTPTDNNPSRIIHKENSAHLFLSDKIRPPTYLLLRDSHEPDFTSYTNSCPLQHLLLPDASRHNPRTTLSAP